MIRSIPPVALFAVVGLLALPAVGWAVYPPPIKDDGKFFSKEALAKANSKIRDLYQKYKKDVVIETLETLSEEQEKKLKAETAKKFFIGLAETRAKEMGLNGLILVISRKPQHLATYADSASEKVFTVARRDKVFAAFREQFAKEKFDAGLLAGLDEIEAALRAGTK